MKLIIFYGADQLGLREQVLKIKQRFDPLLVTEIEGKVIELGQFLTQSGEMLFTGERLLIWENPDEDLIFSKLPSREDLTVVLVFPKEIAPVADLWKNAQKFKPEVYHFPKKTEVSVFPYLDYLAEGNPQAWIELEKLYPVYGGQYLFTMIFYNLRKFILTPSFKSHFVREKYLAQKRRFHLQKIKQLYAFALEVDYKIKSGLMEEKTGLEFLTAKFLEP